jgi:hypothetical protein
LREVLPNNRQRWQQTYRLAPLLTNRVPIVPAALRVRPGGQNETTLEWTDAGSLAVTVTSTVENASVDALRPPTDIEQLPTPSTPPTPARGWLFGIVPVCLVVAFILVRLARRTPTADVRHDAAWALAELPDDVTADRCAAVLRAYVGEYVGLDARALTTAELVARVSEVDLLRVEQRHTLHALLEQCDQQRFSGIASAMSLGPVARAWVQQTATERPEEPRSA